MEIWDCTISICQIMDFFPVLKGNIKEAVWMQDSLSMVSIAGGTWGGADHMGLLLPWCT